MPKTHIKKSAYCFFRNITMGLLVWLLCSTAYAQTVIRDAETEKALLSQLKKIFTAAGLNPENAKSVLILDNSINAFVAGGQTVFIHTGLITQAKTWDDVTFVLAHETGHIVAGHVVQGVLQQKKLQTASLISGLLGTAAGIAAGKPEAGIAVLMGSQTSGAGLFSAYRQTQESAADRIAVDILNKTGNSVIGFKNIMTTLKNEERLTGDFVPSYMQTHPLTQERIRDLERFWQNASAPKKDPTFDKIRAKLIGFLYPPDQIKLEYTGSDTPSLYANSIRLFRTHDIKNALKMIDVLIEREPENPWFYELKGQFLFESAQIIPAIKAYEQALRLAPNEHLIKLALVTAQIESTDRTYLKNAQRHLDEIVRSDPENAQAWLLFATVYDRLKETDLKAYAMARMYASLNKISKAREWAKKALTDDFKTRYPAYTQILNDILDMPHHD